MSRSGPCLCGDPGCSSCFPGSARRYREWEKLLDRMSRENAACPHAMTRTKAQIKSGAVKRAWGEWWCRECLIEEFGRRKLEKANRPVPAPRWETEYDTEDYCYE